MIAFFQRKGYIMQVNTNYNHPSFGIATFTKEALPLLRKMPAKQRRQIEQLQQIVKNTENWDLEIGYNKYSDNFYPTYKNKNKFARIQEHCGGIDAYRVEGNTVYANSYTCDENVYDELKFSSPVRAREAYNIMKGRDFKLSPFGRAARYILSLKLLDESYEFMKNNN